MTHSEFIIAWALVVLLMISLFLGKIPKTYKGKFWDFLRANYHKHIFGGGIIGMVLSTTFFGVPGVIQLFLTVFISGVLGLIWEAAWATYNKTEADYNDVILTVIAALIPVICHM